VAYQGLVGYPSWAVFEAEVHHSSQPLFASDCALLLRHSKNGESKLHNAFHRNYKVSYGGSLIDLAQLDTANLMIWEHDLLVSSSEGFPELQMTTPSIYVKSFVILKQQDPDGEWYHSGIHFPSPLPLSYFPSVRNRSIKKLLLLTATRRSALAPQQTERGNSKFLLRSGR